LGDGAALTAEMATALKLVNTGNQEQTTTAGKLIITKSALVDDLVDSSFDGLLFQMNDPTDFSSAGFKKVGSMSANGAGLTTDFGTSFDGGQEAKVTIGQKAATISATATNVTFNGTQQSQAPATRAGFFEEDDILFDGGSATGISAGTYSEPIRNIRGDDAFNYIVSTVQANLVIAPANSPEPPKPIVPIVPPTPNTLVTLAAANNNFELAGAEGQCTANSLEKCDCETATNESGKSMDGIQICYEPKNPSLSAL
jgi:hypothetical protein